MKITEITGYPVKVGIRNQYIVVVETDECICGVGEEHLERELAMQGVLERQRISHERRPTAHRASLADDVPRCLLRRGTRSLALPSQPSCIALWDILGKWLGVPRFINSSAAPRATTYSASPRRAR